MGPYSIHLPDNIMAMVVHKREFTDISPSPLQLFANLVRKKRIGYIVKLGNENEYRVFKTKKEGRWLEIGDTEITLNIKDAIDQYESQKGENSYKECF